MNEFIDAYMDLMPLYHLAFGVFVIMWAVIDGREQNKPYKKGDEKKSDSTIYGIGVLVTGFLCGFSWLIGISEKMANTGRF